MIKVWLDDERVPQDGWVWTHTSDETIDLLRTGEVTVLSLDYNLGRDERSGTGNDVLIWIELQMATADFVPPGVIEVHTRNSSARVKMEQAIKQIRKLAGRNRKNGPA